MVSAYPCPMSNKCQTQNLSHVFVSKYCFYFSIASLSPLGFFFFVSCFNRMSCKIHSAHKKLKYENIQLHTLGLKTYSSLHLRVPLIRINRKGLVGFLWILVSSFIHNEMKFIFSNRGHSQTLRESFDYRTSADSGS